MKDWGRNTARSRYDSGGAVPLPRPRPDIEGAARQELGRRMRDTETFSMPDNTGSMKMPYQPKSDDVYKRDRELRLKGVADI